MTNPSGNQQYWPQGGGGAGPSGHPPAASYPGSPGVGPAGPWPQQPGSPQHNGHPVPPSVPVPGRPRRRKALVIGAGVLAVVVVVAIAFTVNWSSDTAPSKVPTYTIGPSAPSTGDVTATGDMYRFPPKTLVPSPSEVQQATLQSLSVQGEPDLSVGTGLAIVPPVCLLVETSASAPTWGAASSIAGQLFTDGTANAFNNSSWTGVAVFPSVQAAKDSMGKVTDALKNCTVAYQRPATGGATTPDTRQVSNVQQSGDTVTWTSSVIGPGSPWVCSKAYGIKGNVAANASSCGVAETDSSGRLVALVLAKLK